MTAVSDAASGADFDDAAAVTLYVSPRGLITSTIRYGTRIFNVEFDFIDHQLRIRTSDGETRAIALESKSVAVFYAQLMRALVELGIETQIQSRPNEVDPAIPFAEGSPTCHLRRPGRAIVLAPAGAGRPGAAPVPVPLRR